VAITLVELVLFVGGNLVLRAREPRLVEAEQRS
jgi:hypothetical protein